MASFSYSSIAYSPKNELQYETRGSGGCSLHVIRGKGLLSIAFVVSNPTGAAALDPYLPGLESIPRGWNRRSAGGSLGSGDLSGNFIFQGNFIFDFPLHPVMQRGF